MICLALDTSGPVGSVSLASGGSVIASGRFGERRSHMREIGEAVDRVLANGGCTVRDIQRIAIVSGPGSFTGLRIGMAFVKGLCAARGLPVVTVDGLMLLAVPLVEQSGLVLSMIDARKDQVYAALYRPAGTDGGAEQLLAPAVDSPGEVLASVARLEEFGKNARTVACAGSGAMRYARRIGDALGPGARLAPAEMHLPSTDILALLARSMTPVADERLPELTPFYIRASDAELKPLREVRPGE